MSYSESPFDIRDEIRARYASVAREEHNCCEAATSCDCGSVSERIGYSKEALEQLPEDCRSDSSGDGMAALGGRDFRKLHSPQESRGGLICGLTIESGRAQIGGRKFWFCA